ncbi:MAG: tetratricopeptide repeat protein [Planctomycetota bacterium]
MADDQAKTRDPDAMDVRPDSEASRAGEEPGGAFAEGPGPLDWASLWQAPTILISLLLIAIGLYVASTGKPEHDFDGAFDEVDRLITAGEFESARLRLHETIEPHLDDATEAERARFEATVADWLAAQRIAAGVPDRVVSRTISERYAKALEMGLGLEPYRLELWARAAIESGDLAAGRARLAELEALSLAVNADPELRQRRNRVLRTLVERSLHEPELPYDEVMRLLTDFREDPLVDAADELWAAARQAELRIEDGRFTEAVDRLMLDARRLELAGGDQASLPFGELHALLGRGYYHLGEPAYAEYHAGLAVESLDRSHPARSTALVLLGQLASGEGRFEDARELLQDAIRDGVGTPAELPARMSLAEVHGILGADDASIDAYTALVRAMATAGPRRDVTRDSVTASLVDRHLAALVTGRPTLALRYLEVATRLYGQAVPNDLLKLLAATHRQIAQDLTETAPHGDPAKLDPETRYTANGHHRQAGDLEVQRVRALVGAPDADEEWAEALWRAALDYDSAGESQLAADHFREYVSSRPADDPRRPGALFHLGRALHALELFEDAADAYEQVIDASPRSMEAASSYVPLAEVYVLMDRAPDARQLLRRVVLGQTGLDPASADYRIALFELGKLLRSAGQPGRAIERLEEAVARYPQDPRLPEVLFHLADAHRAYAKELASETTQSPPPLPDRIERLQSQRVAALESAAQGFDQVRRALEAVPRHERDRLQLDLLRYSSIYRGDCAYELERYDEAIQAYEEVVRSYATEYVSLNALIQIVNCYSAIGDAARAHSAHERAMRRLAQLPDAAFEADDALLNRQAWERWLSTWPLGSMQAGAVN